MLHFAYGSNMSRAPVLRRCPGAVAAGTAILRDHRFTIMANGYASVAAAPGQAVHGVLWRLTPDDLAALDAYEDIAGGLYRRAMRAVVQGGATKPAQVYLGCDEREGRPRPGYLALVAAAAREWGLPPDYIDGLSRKLHGDGNRLRVRAGGTLQ